jgi:hypothetical protein
MGRVMGMGSSAGWGLLPQLSKAAPELSAHFVHEALRRAINGVARLPGAAVAADKVLVDTHGDVDLAIHELIEDHVRYAGLQGFATNLGGLTTAAVLIPANITGLALVQCRLVACIAHLRGYDLDDQRVRNAILTCILGEDSVKTLIRKHQLPSTPMGMATAPTYDAHIDRVIASEVTSELLTKVAGKRMAATVGRRIPVVGGVIGAGADGFGTWQIGRYADRELLPRTRR